MNEFREKLLDRMIRIYGFENEIVISFAQMCESYPSESFDKAFETIVKSHEENPQIREEDDDE